MIKPNNKTNDFDEFYYYNRFEYLNEEEDKFDYYEYDEHLRNPSTTTSFETITNPDTIINLTNQINDTIDDTIIDSESESDDSTRMLSCNYVIPNIIVNIRRLFGIRRYARIYP